MKTPQRLLTSAIVIAAAGAASNIGHATVITGWNVVGNVDVSTAVINTAGESVIYDRAPSAPGAKTSGKVIFDGTEADSPGLIVDSIPFSVGPTASPQNAGGCIRANNPTTTCGGDFQSGKRVKNVITGSGPVDFVFDTDPSSSPLNPDGSVNTDPYRVFHRLINDTGSDISDFIISLGNGVGQDFVQSRDGDGLSFSTSFLFRDPTGGAADVPATTQFPFGLFGDAADNNNFDLDGFFAPERTGFNVTRENDQITSSGIFGPYSSVFGPWMSLDDVRTGAFWDDDGDPLTDNLLIAWLNGDGLWEQRRDFGGTSDTGLESIAPITFADFNALASSFGTACGDAGEAFCGFGSGLIEDLANLNVNYAIDVAGYQGTSFTLRIDVSTVPVPATLALFGLGLAGLGWKRRKTA